MDYFERYIEIVLDPAEFFKKIPLEEGYIGPVFFAYICSMIPSIVLIREEIPSYGGLLIIFFGFLGGFILRILFDTAVLHGLFKAFGGKAVYKSTFQLVTFSYAAELLQTIPILANQFNLIPTNLAPMLILYFLYLLSIGGQFVHNLSIKRAVFAALIWACSYHIGLYSLYFIAEPYI